MLRLLGLDAQGLVLALQEITLIVKVLLGNLVKSLYPSRECCA